MNIARSLRRDLALTGASGLGVLLVLAGVLTNRYRFEALPLGPHPEHLAILAALVILLALGLAGRARLTFQASDLVLGAYLVVTLGASLAFPADRLDSVQYWARMLMAVAVYFIVRWLVTATDIASAFRLALKAFLVFGVLEALYGIAAWFIYPLGLDLGVDQYLLGSRGPGEVVCTFTLTMHGTLWEPNVFGSSLMCVFLVGATLFVSEGFTAWRRPLGLALAVMLIALALNATRAALGTLAVGMILIILLARGLALAHKLGWGLAALLLIVLINVPSVEASRLLMQLPTAPGVAERAPCAEWIAQGMLEGVDAELASPGSEASGTSAIRRIFEGQTVTSRWVSYRAAWEEVLARPILGNGANSFSQTFTTTAHTPGWISNMILMALHDSGVVGLALLLGWLLWFGWRIFKSWRHAAESPLRTMVLALGIGLVCLLLAYQATTMFWFGFIWWLFAVVETGARALSCRAA